MTTLAHPSIQEAKRGWYPDPAGSPGTRYWYGQAWSDRVRTPEQEKLNETLRKAGLVNLFLLFAMFALAGQPLWLLIFATFYFTARASRAKTRTNSSAPART